MLTYGSGIGTGVFVARYLGPTPSTCALSNIATLAQPINSGTIGDANAIENGMVTPVGEGTFNAAMMPSDERNIGQCCGASAMDPDSSAVSRTKRPALVNIAHSNE